MPRPAAEKNPNDNLTIMQIKAEFRLPFCRRTVQKMFENADGVRVLGRRERTKANPHRPYRTLFVPRRVIERVLADMLVKP